MNAFLGAVLLAAMPAVSFPQDAPARLPPETLLRQFDRDGDGRLGRDEAPPRMQQRWEQIDTDRDGFVTLDELKARDARIGAGETPQRMPGAGGPPENAARFEPAAKFSVITLGTGSPQYDRERSGPCTLIQCDGRFFLVDMGNGTQARLDALGVNWRQIDAILLTHHHLDHDEEFVPVFLHTHLAGGSPEVVGPPGTKKYADFVTDFYAEDIAYRLQRRGRTMADFGKTVVREIQGGETFALGRVKVTTAKVNHTIHTVAYRFEVDGRSIVVSGDTAYSEALVALARGADVLVLDAGAAPVRAGEAARPEGAGGRGDPAHAHASRQEVGDMAQKSGAKKLVLVHLAPGEVDEAATRQALGAIYQGEVTVARDLLEIAPGGAGTAAAAAPGGGARVYVNAAKTAAPRDGGSWAGAFATVQEAIDAAAAKGGGEVWVARGTYRPTAGTDRNATIQMRKGVRLLGGFAGTETKPDGRDWGRNVTTLSGDIGREGEPADNSVHVVTGADDAMLDGFTISGGYGLNAGPPAGGSPPRGAGGPPIHTTPDAVLSGAQPGSGAGMLNFQCAPQIRNCTFKDNSGGKGGAMYNMAAKSFPPRPESPAPAPLVVNCRFLANHARGRGGAVANDLGTSPEFRDCVFAGNACEGKGGAMYNDFGCSPLLANCLFATNAAPSAGAIGNDGGSSPLLVQCTFTGNSAESEGAALYQGTGPANNPVVIGCILWGDRCANGPAEIFAWHDNDPAVSNSCVQGGWPGIGNSDRDPLLGADFQPGAGSPDHGHGYSAAKSFASVKVLDPRRPRTLGPPARMAPARPRAPGSAAAPQLVFVNAARAGGPGDGASWRTAFASLQSALAAAKSRPLEIWVAAGTYKPTDGADRSPSFELPEGVKVFGGFRGTETQRGQRDWRAHVAILSGDIGRGGDPSDNSFHVLVGADDAVLDGFVVRDGNADGPTYDGKGGGMVNYRRGPQAGPMGPAAGFSPRVANCTFAANRAREGGAVYDYDRGAPEFSNCRFAGNAADYGGAMVDRVGVRAAISNCVFDGNTAVWRAGALYLDYGSRPIIAGCRFVNNRSACHGGALATISRASQLEATIPLLRDCVFSGNTAAKRGGAIANSDSAILGLEGCAFSANRAAAGNVLANDYRARAVIVNARGADDAEIASDESSSVSRNRADWPEQAAPQPAQGFRPPR